MRRYRSEGHPVDAIFESAYFNAVYGKEVSTAVIVAAKLLMALGLLLIPTLLMGGTLPVLSRVFARSFEQVGRTLGAGRVRVFWSITFPLAARGIICGLPISISCICQVAYIASAPTNRARVNGAERSSTRPPPADARYLRRSAARR